MVQPILVPELGRRRRNVAHTRQSGPDPGLGFEAKSR